MQSLFVCTQKFLKETTCYSRHPVSVAFWYWYWQCSSSSRGKRNVNMETWNTSSLLRAVPRVLFATDNVLILTQSCSLLPSTSSDDFFVRTFKSPRWWVCSCSLCLISANSLSCWRNARLACPQAQWCYKSVFSWVPKPNTGITITPWMLFN